MTKKNIQLMSILKKLIMIQMIFFMMKYMIIVKSVKRIETNIFVSIVKQIFVINALKNVKPIIIIL